MTTEHDAVMYALQRRFQRDGRPARINPRNTKQYKLNGYYPDIIVGDENTGPLLVIEVETAETVGTNDSITQWLSYAAAYGSRNIWLALPELYSHVPKELSGVYQQFKDFGVITWQPSPLCSGAYNFSFLPSL